MVSQSHAVGSIYTSVTTSEEEHTETSIQNGEKTCTLAETCPSGMSCIRQSLQNKGLSENTLRVIMASWRQSTQKQYAGHLQKWQRFCCRRNIDIFSPSVAEVLDFLTELFESSCSYSTLNTARSALSTIITLPGNISIGNHPLVTRFLKGAFQTRPTLPKYTSIWDVKVVLNYLKTFSLASKLTLKDLTLKLTIFLMLVSSQRIQTVQLLDIEHMKVCTSTVEFIIPCKVKQTRPGKHLKNLNFKAYAPDERLCVYHYLTKYLEVTKPLRTQEQSQLLVSFAKPRGTVSRNTVSRWLKSVLCNSGIDTSQFTAYSTRGASVSAAKTRNTPMDIILSAGGWSNIFTFSKYYNKVINTQESFFADNVLN